MAFHDIELDRKVSLGSLVGDMGKTTVIELDGGGEQRVEHWPDSKIVANLGYYAKTTDKLKAVTTFKRARGHRANTWRFWHPLDYSTNPANDQTNAATVAATATDEVIGTGAVGVTQFQLVKRYVSGAVEKKTNIRKPIAGSVVVALDGTPQLAGWTVNLSTGVVTFSVAPANGVVVTAGCHFNYEVRFESDDTMVSIESARAGDVPDGLRIISVLDESILEEDFYPRGSSTQAVASALELTPQMGAFVRLNPSVNAVPLLLPDPTGWDLGGPYWKLQNLSGANTIDVKYNGVSIATIAVAGDAAGRDVVELWLGLDSTGTVVEWCVVT
jgi:uncharacterized protein (TIGR02217 family)